MVFSQKWKMLSFQSKKKKITFVLSVYICGVSCFGGEKHLDGNFFSLPNLRPGPEVITTSDALSAAMKPVQGKSVLFSWT